jgi:hypothetical protein
MMQHLRVVHTTPPGEEAYKGRSKHERGQCDPVARVTSLSFEIYRSV